MAAIRTVLIDKFSAYGNPFVSLATSVSSIFSSSPLMEQLPKPEVAGAVPAEPTRLMGCVSSLCYIPVEHFKSHPRIHTSLRSLLTGRSDFGQDNDNFVVTLFVTQHALDFVNERDFKEVDLERLPTIESDYDVNEEEEVSTEPNF